MEITCRTTTLTTPQGNYRQSTAMKKKRLQPWEAAAGMDTHPIVESDSYAAKDMSAVSRTSRKHGTNMEEQFKKAARNHQEGVKGEYKAGKLQGSHKWRLIITHSRSLGTDS